MIVDRYFLIPHAIAGVLATALGPFQFSTRFRQRHLATHRLMGKVYIISVFVAAPMVIILGRGFTLRPGSSWGDVQASLWLLCTLAAFITARNRQITVHRQWMVRSYAFTLNFIFSRFLNFLPSATTTSLRDRLSHDPRSPYRPLLLCPGDRLQLARTNPPPRLIRLCF